uniref:Protein kinase domain-containing protein n=1 Tax=Nelumbo nucifera TaxID=4432 RepID=A0A822ZH00_NELNU|nr:TPA_asm: hypothetical protein HUJ06_003614 [Nelumbo nucifera]
MKRRREEELQEVDDMESHHGRKWTKGETIGRGSFGTVSLARAKRRNTRQSYFPPVMAVKWAEVSRSCSLQKEKEVLANLGRCPHILHCFGDEITTENGEMIYNMLLEYGSGGTLADQIKKAKASGGLPESDVKRYTRSILEGLNHIHARGYVHCDIKPENILLMSPPASPCCSSRKRKRKSRGGDYVVKIGDFGLAKKVYQNKRKLLEPCWRGTPLYMSPESIIDNIQEPPSDIWALGCLVVEMVSGKPVWDSEPDVDVDDFLSQICLGRELPRIPSEMSKEGKDFLKRCFVRTAKYRWTADMLLLHPFIAGEGVQEVGEVLCSEPSTSVVSSLWSCSLTDYYIQQEEARAQTSSSSSINDWNLLGEADSPVSSWSEDVGKTAEEEIKVYRKRRKYNTSSDAFKTSPQSSSSTGQQQWSNRNLAASPESILAIPADI